MLFSQGIQGFYAALELHNRNSYNHKSYLEHYIRYEVNRRDDNEKVVMYFCHDYKLLIGFYFDRATLKHLVARFNEHF